MYGDLSLPNLITREKWAALIQCKEEFLKEGKSPLQNPYMRKEVAQSWIRSKEYGVDPGKKREPNLEPAEFKRIIEENRVLIDTTIPLIHTYKPLVTISKFYFYLYDKNGVELLEKGKLEKSKESSTHFTEEAFGTMAHLLALRYNTPIQLIGAENYCYEASENISSAAPIVDENGRPIGCLLLLLPHSDIIFDQGFHAIQAHSLGWVTSIALAIGQQIILKNKNEKLAENSHILETTLDFLDEGIITVDKAGEIIRANLKAKKYLGLDYEQTLKNNIKDFGAGFGWVKQVLQGKRLDYIEDSIQTPKGRRNYLFSSRPVFNDGGTIPDGAVIRISSVKDMRDYVARQNSAAGKFTFQSMIGQSLVFKKAKELAMQFAESRENILLMGESGTGKELFAQSIHNKRCPNGPFIALNCAAMPRTLVESELFGYEGGSFTGAEKNGRIGKIEMANGGTLFLDEIGDMPLELQGVLLRVLEDNYVVRIGGHERRSVDFRLIAATNQNLHKLVQEHLFRADLFFRLSTLKIEIPPLRERGNDILLFATHFLTEYCIKMGWSRPKISEAATLALLRYPWPGNVRQLEKAMIYAASTAKGGIIDLQNLPEEILLFEKKNRPAPPNHQSQFNLNSLEMEATKNALLETGYHVEKAAELLGIGRSTLYKRLKRYHIDIPPKNK